MNLRKWRIYNQRYLKYDFIASIVVFMVAIPLCLGIALASGAPPLSGILSGIIGGIVVGSLSASQVSVSGPAAGMAAVVLAAITQLGDFNSFLLALTLAGIIQIVTGALRAGFIADYVPSNVVQGLLCAIGILLIIKQFPSTFSVVTDPVAFKEQLLETTGGFSIRPFLSYHLNEGAVIISCISFALLIFFEKAEKSIKTLRGFPIPIIVVIASIITNELFIFFDSPLVQTTPYLVNIPDQTFSDLVKQIQTPAFSSWTNPNIYLYAFIIAIVASLETLLNVKAGEKLDKKRRYCSKDKELLAQGTGNFIAGLAGGIPITSVIVRTSVNVQAGGQTKISTIFHGLFLLIAIALIPSWLNKIPLSALAVILIYTGYKLTKPSIYKSIYQQGLDRFIPFIITVISIIFFNLLVGILIGLGVSLFYILKSNSQARLNIIKEIHPNIITSRLVLPQQISFLNKASLVAELATLPRNSQLIIDARYSDYIDKEILELIKEFKEEQAPLKHIQLSLIGFKDRYEIHKHVDFINVTSYGLKNSLKPYQVLTFLREGNQRFLDGTRIHKISPLDIKNTAITQNPMAVVLGCIDSRVPVETIFDMSLGDLFCIRIAGNVINDDILASMEYACYVVGAKLILVLGHTRCGAIQAACDGVEQGHITQLLEKINPAIMAEVKTLENRTSTNLEFIAHVTAFNIGNTLQQVYQKSRIIRQMLDNESIALLGATYDVGSGRVHFDDYLRNFPSKEKNDHLEEMERKLLNR